MVCTASVSIIVGAVLGTGLGFVTDAVSAALRAPAEERYAAERR